jgi:Mycothiol maleylpyruvate isomerase N-terminal domain
MTSVQQREAAQRLRADQRFWRELVAEVGRERMLEPGPMGEWTFKDLAAHLGAWRNYRIPALEAVARGDPLPPPPWPAGLAEDDYDAINAWLQERDAKRSLDDILDDYDRSFERLAAALEALPESVAHDPHGLPWMDGEAAVDADFTEHLHGEHLPSIRAWLDRKP